jgi:hypothetical protein
MKKKVAKAKQIQTREGDETCDQQETPAIVKTKRQQPKKAQKTQQIARRDAQMALKGEDQEDKK